MYRGRCLCYFVSAPSGTEWAQRSLHRHLWRSSLPTPCVWRIFVSAGTHYPDVQHRWSACISIFWFFILATVPANQWTAIPNEVIIGSVCNSVCISRYSIHSLNCFVHRVLKENRIFAGVCTPLVQHSVGLCSISTQNSFDPPTHPPL